MYQQEFNIIIITVTVIFSIQMDNINSDLWRQIGQFLSRRDRSIVDIIQEETEEEQDARFKYQALADAGLLRTGQKIFEESSWQHNYQQIISILDALSNTSYAKENQYINYVFDVIPFLFPEYMEGMDRDLIFALDETPTVLQAIGNNLLRNLNSRYRIRLELGLKELYRLYPRIDKSVINYLLLRMGARILRYGGPELLEFVAERNIPIKRIYWNIQ